MVDFSTEMVFDTAVMVTDSLVMDSKGATPLARLIEERGLRKGWVAARLGMDASAMSRLLAGRRELRLEEAIKAAELFGVDVRELVPGGKR